MDGYEILRRRRFLGEDSLQTLVATTYTDSTATESTRYTYRVKAIRSERSRRSNFARVDPKDPALVRCDEGGPGDWAGAVEVDVRFLADLSHLRKQLSRLRG